MDGQLEAVRQDIGSVKDKILAIEQDLAAAKEAKHGEREKSLFDMLLSLNNQLLSLQEKENILLRSQAPSKPCFQLGRRSAPQAARPDKPASRFAEFLQTQAGKQQMAAGAGSVISLPLWVNLMGLSRYGRQLFVRPSYLQLKDRILQLHQASGTYGDNMMNISGTPGIGKSFCALYMASYWIAQGTRVIYELHDQDEAASVSWYHFPPESGEAFCVDLQQDVSHHVREELQQCRGSVDIFSSTVAAELAELAFKFAGGVPRTVLQLPAQPANSSIPIRSLIVGQLETAVNMLSSEALQDTVNQILTVGYHNGSDSLFHMSCHGLLERGHPSIVFATQFAAQLVLYKLGEVARYRQLAWFHGAAGHAHWQGARGYWFESLAHQVLANGGNHTFRLVGSDTLYTLALPRAEVFEFEVVQDLAGKFVANSMDVYAQPKYSNFPTFDALNCGSLWFQVTVAKKHSEFIQRL
ncbi:TPA: hypothetical protein ACH3X1_014060 [Trebouxia sp. C0004]